MNKLLFIGAFFVVLHSPAFSQSGYPDSNIHRHQIDSLKKEIQHGKDDSSLVKNLCLLSEFYRMIWPDSALNVCYRIVELEKKLNYPSGRELGYQSFSGVFYVHKDYDSCIYYMLKGLDLCISHHFYFQENEYRRGLNNVYFMKDDYTNVMKISTEGLASAERMNDKKWMAHYNNVLGCVAMKLKNFKLAERFFSLHLQLAKQVTDNRGEEGHAFLNLSDLFVAENKKSEAISAIQSALTIYQAQRNEPFTNSFGGYFSFAGEAYCYNKLADLFQLSNNNDSALKYSLRAIRIVQDGLRLKHAGFNLYDIAAYYINAGHIYNKTDRADEALLYLWRGLALADSIDHRELKRDAYEQLSISFALKRRFDSAYFYQLTFSRLNDSILSENSEKDILQRDADLQIERQKRIQQTEISRQQVLRNIIIGISIFVIVIVVMMYNRRRIKQKMVFQQQLNKQQTELMNTVIVVQDQERKRIAEDLHDTLGSILSAAKLKLSAIAENDNDHGQHNHYDDTLGLLDEAVNEMRNISHNLLPASLLRLGLVAGLKNLMNKISNKSGLQINFVAYGFKERIDETIEVSIYRIVLEAINNVVKHAKAKNVTVQLVQHDNYINILVEDDGVGFDRSAVLKEQGIGLNNILSRVDHMKGNIEIDTKPRAGTVINIDIPYKQHNR